MNCDDIEQKLGFSEIRSQLLSHCISPLGRSRVEQMQFLAEPAAVRLLHAQLSEYQQILEEQTEQPPQDFFDLRPTLHRIRLEGAYLDEDEISSLARSLTTLHAWLPLCRQEADASPRFPSLEQMAQGIFSFHSVAKRVDQLLDKFGRIRDDASPELSRIRRELRQSEGSVSATLNRILRTAQAEGLVERDAAPTLRDGRLVLPVSPAMKRRLKGIVHDESATGKTVFIEPAEVVEANNRIRELEAEERRELIRLLREFTETLRPNLKELLRAFEFLADIEFLRVKHQFALAIQGVSPHIADAPLVDWTLARHPLLEQSLARQGKRIVPLEIQLQRRQRILLISGPNAGGKSICLKTVGILQYMLQCGLPVSMGVNSRCGVFADIFVDIGDAQSIADDLSTYSGHLMNMKEMMRRATPASLLLIDEFGSGTEPTIGGAIAQAILARFAQRGPFAVITTHYQNLKQLAEDTPGIVNGAMLYDRQQMQPLFQLQIGHPGSSFAVEIARKTGIPEDIIQQATQIVGQDYVNADKYLLDITRDKRYWESKRQNIHSQEKQMQDLIQKYETQITALRSQQQDILRQAREQARQILDDANALVERTIREIREAQAEREQTKAIRRQMDERRQQLAVEADQPQQADGWVEKKMRQIEARRQRQAERKASKQNATGADGKTTNSSGAVSAEPENVLTVGSYVRIQGKTTVGRILEIHADMALVAFGMMHTRIALSRLQSAPKPAPSPQVAISYVNSSPQRQIHQTGLRFKQEIDVRGMRGDEALSAVTHYIDDAILLGASRVRILHGTGNGILRQLIREYLQSTPGVRSAHDEHVQLGGAGITVVELA